MKNKIKSWDDVTLEKWIQLQSIKTEYEATKSIERISILCDIPLEQLRKLPIKEHSEIASTVGFLSTKLPTEVKTVIEIQGIKFGMNPSMELTTTAEIEDSENWKFDPINNMPLYCAMIYRPIIWENEDKTKWEIEEYSSKGFLDRVELFKKYMPITVAHSATFFFSSLSMGLIESLLTYSTLMTQTPKKKTKKKPKVKKN